MTSRTKIAEVTVRIIMYVVVPGAIALMAAVATLAME